MLFVIQPFILIKGEIKALPQLIKSKVLKQVRQIGVEIHTGQEFKQSKIKSILKSLLSSYQKLHGKLGFRLAAYNPNLCIGTMLDPNEQYYNYHDLLFVNKH